MVKQYNVAETLTAQRLNDYLSADLTRLWEKNVSIFTLQAARNTYRNRSANVAVPFDDPIKVTHTMPESGSVRVSFHGIGYSLRHSGTGTGTNTRLDVKVDDDWFISSRTPTSLTDGAFIFNMTGYFQYHAIMNGSFLLDNVDKGLHTYELYGATQDNAFSIELLAGAELVVEQYGRNLENILVYGEPL